MIGRVFDIIIAAGAYVESDLLPDPVTDGVVDLIREEVEAVLTHLRHVVSKHSVDDTLHRM